MTERSAKHVFEVSVPVIEGVEPTVWKNHLEALLRTNPLLQKAPEHLQAIDVTLRQPSRLAKAREPAQATSQPAEMRGPGTGDAGFVASYPRRPRALASAAERSLRRCLMQLPHIRPLTEFVHELRATGRGEVPYFDPLDGGVNANTLFLMEKPGPMTVPRGMGKAQGSGFISRDNNDRTAPTVFEFMRRAGLQRRDTLLWNIVPFWNGTRDIADAELVDGLERLHTLLARLARVQTIVLVGRNAAAAAPSLRDDYRLLESSHPGPQVRARWPKRWENIPTEWARAKES